MSLSFTSYKVYFWRISFSSHMGMCVIDDRPSCQGHPWTERVKLHGGCAEQAACYHRAQHYPQNAEFPISVRSLLIKHSRLCAELNEHVV